MQRFPTRRDVHTLLIADNFTEGADTESFISFYYVTWVSGGANYLRRVSVPFDCRVKSIRLCPSADFGDTIVRVYSPYNGSVVASATRNFYEVSKAGILANELELPNHFIQKGQTIAVTVEKANADTGFVVGNIDLEPI